MLCVHETKTFLHAALADKFFHRSGDVEVVATMGGFKPKVFSERFHGGAWLASKELADDIFDGNFLNVDVAHGQFLEQCLAD